MKNKVHLALSSTAVLVMVSSAAFGYALLSPTRRWFNADTPRHVTVDERGLASVGGGDPDHGVTAAVNAVMAWNAGGLLVTTASPGPVAYVQGDGISDIVFDDPLGICTGTCIASTLTGWYDTSEAGTCGGATMVRISDADVSFNTAFDFTTPAQGGCSSEIYLDSVVTHEVGHLIGLAHSGSQWALMYPKIVDCDDKQLGADDISGRDALYGCTLVEGVVGGCGAAGSSCADNGECCSNSCKGPRGRRTCR